MAEKTGERFSRKQAQVKLGRRVRSIVQLDGVSAGTYGRVMEIDEIETDGFELIIEWDSRIGEKLQHDWFSKEQYEHCLIDEAI
jgi:hypothetical protein